MARYVISTVDGKHKLGKAINFQTAKSMAAKLSREYYITRLWNFDTRVLMATFDNGTETTNVRLPHGENTNG